MITDAHSKSIVDVANSLGMTLVKKGKHYTWAEHDSLVINVEKNSFFWNAQGFGGNTIKLVQTIKQCDFKEAVSFLANAEFSSFEAKPIVRKPFRYFLKDHKSYDLLKTYLIKERRLSEETVDFFLQQGLIAQASYTDQMTGKSQPVVVFKAYDKFGKMQGMTVQGIWEDKSVGKRGHLKKTHGDGFYGLRLQIGERPENLSKEAPMRIIAFEAPIDLMSYYELYKDKLTASAGYTVLVAMNGLRQGTISKCFVNELVQRPAKNASEEDERKHTLEVFGTHTKPSGHFQIILAVDNDEAGRKFSESLELKAVDVKPHLPPLQAGQSKNDWNDQLKSLKSVEKEKSRKVENATFLPKNAHFSFEEGALRNMVKSDIAGLFPELAPEATRFVANWTRANLTTYLSYSSDEKGALLHSLIKIHTPNPFEQKLAQGSNQPADQADINSHRKGLTR